MNRKLFFTIVVGIVIIALVVAFRWWPQGTALIWQVSNGGQQLLPLVVIAALIDSINPCAFSIFLLTIAFLFSIGKLRSNILLIGSMYIFGIFLAYMLIGLGLIQALHLFNVPHFMGILGAYLLIVLGFINLGGLFIPRFPIRFQLPRAAHQPITTLMDKGTIPTAFGLGILVGLCEFPCTGGPYLMVLGLLHDHETYFRGVGYLILYNLIFILPLVILLVIAGDQTILGRVQQWQKQKKFGMRLWGSIGIILLGLAILVV